MLNNAVWKSLLKFVVLLVIFNFVSCGGSTSSSPPSPDTVSYTITAEAGSNGSVTPSGVTTVAQGASQSYTITPNSGFAVATLEVDGATVATSTTHTFANVRANHTISATFSAAQAGDIALSLVPARTSGVAPLAVFFDASGTTDVAVTARPFHDLEYTWDFGDPTAGTWAYGAQPGVSSKNSATGPVASHVFEKPGTYTVTLTAFDGTNTVTTSKTITVDNPDVVFAGSGTVCMSTSGTFTNCPSGASHVTTSSLETALGNISSSVKRILFNRGETWTNTATTYVTQAGPGYIGAYGTGAKPFVQATGNNHGGILFSGADWRVMDMALDAIGTTGTSFISVTSNQITELRLDATNIGAVSYNTDNAIHDQLTVQDSTANGLNAGAGTVNSWIYGEHFSFQGNHMDNTRPSTGVIGGEHVLRFPKVIKGVISNNDLWNPPAGKHCLDLHSVNEMSNEPVWNGTYTEQVVIADNYFKAGAGVPWHVAINAQTNSFDERLRNIIFERNYLTTTGSNSAMLAIDSTVGVTVRNNIFNMGDILTGVSIGGVTGAPSPPNDLINIYNNTFYSTYVPNNNHVAAIYIPSTTALTTTVRNNLVLTPNDNSYWGVVGTGTTLISSNNLLSTAVSSILTNATPTVPADFALKSGSPAINYGVAVPNFEDFIRATRSTTWDVGAYAY